MISFDATNVWGERSKSHVDCCVVIRSIPSAVLCCLIRFAIESFVQTQMSSLWVGQLASELVLNMDGDEVCLGHLTGHLQSFQMPLLNNSEKLCLLRRMERLLLEMNPETLKQALRAKGPFKVGPLL